MKKLENTHLFLIWSMWARASAIAPLSNPGYFTLVQLFSPNGRDYA